MALLEIKSQVRVHKIPTVFIMVFLDLIELYCMNLQFGVEFRRISLPKSSVDSYENFRSLMERLHLLSEIPFVLSYIDPYDKYVLPINNDDNLRQAVLRAKPLLRVIIRHRCKIILNIISGIRMCI